MPRRKSEQELDDLERRYLGEPSPRRPLAGFILTLLNPGMGWAYIGRLFGGLVVNCAMVVLVGAFLVLWARTRFNPVVPLVALLAGFAGLTVMMASDVAAWCVQRGDGYVLKDGNHPLVYALVALLTWVAPLGGLAWFASTSLFSVDVVAVSEMAPTLLPGDRVIVDRLAFLHRPPRLGEVVGYRVDDSDELQFGRVIAGPGRSAFVHQGLPSIGAQACGQFRLDAASLQQLQARGVDWSEGRTPLLERCGDVAYPVLMPQSVDWGEPDVSEPEDGSIFVLSDDRSVRSDSRDEGRLAMDQIVGRVSWVAWSRDDSARGTWAELSALWDGMTSANGGEGVAARFGRSADPTYQPREVP